VVENPAHTEEFDATAVTTGNELTVTEAIAMLELVQPVKVFVPASE
jgi:hypothetical protein